MQPSDGATIDLDSYENVLREVIPLINGAPLDATLRALPGAGPRFEFRPTETAAPVGTAFIDQSEGSLELDGSLKNRFSCDAGGQFEATYGVSVELGKIDFMDCTVGEKTFDGQYGFNRVGRDGYSVSADAFAVAENGVGRVLSGGRRVGYYRIGSGQNRTWESLQGGAEGIGASFDVLGDAPANVRNYNLAAVSTSFGILGDGGTVQLDDGQTRDVVENPVSSSLSGSFEVVSAPWTDGQSLTVSVDLRAERSFYTWSEADGQPVPDFAVGAEPRPFVRPDGSLSQPQVLDDQATVPFTWRTGEVTITAADGSSMRLVPRDDGTRSFALTLSGVDEPLVRAWSDGFEILCAFDSLEACAAY